MLFSGTPCEIAALYIYLGNNKNLIEHLYTIEVICHGVPSNKIHRMGLKYSGAKRIVSYRTKSQGWLNGNRLVYDFGKDGIKECSNRREDFIFRSYLSFFMSFYRKSCFKCPYASIHRVADLTLGDYWGYDKKKYENYYGVSLVLVNSFKGETLFCDAENINQIPTTWAECLPYNQNLFMPTNKYLFIILSGLVFGSMHVIGNITSPLDWLYVIPYGSLGAAFAIMYQKTDTVYTSTAMHIFHNTALILLSILA